MRALHLTPESVLLTAGVHSTPMGLKEKRASVASHRRQGAGAGAGSWGRTRVVAPLLQEGSREAGGGAGHLMRNHFGQRSVIFTLEVFLLSSYEAA